MPEVNCLFFLLFKVYGPAPQANTPGSPRQDEAEERVLKTHRLVLPCCY